MSARGREVCVEALVDLANGDTLLLGYLRNRRSVITCSGICIRGTKLTLLGFKRTDYVLADCRILHIIPSLHRIITGHRTLAAAYLGESWGSGSQHHSQHSRQQHYLPQNLTSSLTISLLDLLRCASLLLASLYAHLQLHSILLSCTLPTLLPKAAQPSHLQHNSFATNVGGSS
jgi:hypothetical protein